jgi:hypothetical protein
MLNIKCTGGQVIYIQSAFYGRTDSSVCSSGPVSNTNCSANVLSMVKASCQYNTDCTIPVSNDALGGDPCYGIYKYAKIGYICSLPSMF